MKTCNAVCEPCSLREAGEDERADLLESIRGQRLLLALLNEAPDVVAMIGEELDGCYDCLGRLAALYLGSSATYLTFITGSLDGAMTVVTNTLAEDMDRV